MARPKNKEELLSLGSENYDKLRDYIDSLTDDQMHREFGTATMNRNVRDVLAHLYHWHLLFIEWYRIGMKGQKPEMPAPGYTWRTTSELNHKIREDYADHSLSDIMTRLEGSHAEVMGFITRHTDAELFEKKRYKWTGSTSLGAYLISSTSSHYDWALKLIKKGLA